MPRSKPARHIEPTDTKAPPIKFEVNLPVEWSGRSVQYGGGDFNGTLITGLGLPPAYPFDKPSPLARGRANRRIDAPTKYRSRYPTSTYFRQLCASLNPSTSRAFRFDSGAS